MSPFKINQVIQISPESTSRAIKEFQNNVRATNLILGHQVQYEHDVAFIKAGIPFSVSDKRAPLYDREVDGMWQDDKVATFESANGKLSFSHTISYQEANEWRNQLALGKDVIIHSFEYASRDYAEVIYRGSIKFSDIIRDGHLRNGANSHYFVRGLLTQINV